MDAEAATHCEKTAGLRQQGGFSHVETAAGGQTEEVASTAWEGGSTKGHGKEELRSRRSGFQAKRRKIANCVGRQGSKRLFGINKGKTTFEERKKSLQTLKRKTNCLGCGQFGHWAGDNSANKKSKSSA